MGGEGRIFFAGTGGDWCSFCPMQVSNGDLCAAFDSNVYLLRLCHLEEADS